MAAILGSFMPWFKVSAPFVGTVTGSGTDGSDGWITLVLGAVLATVGGLVLRGQRISIYLHIVAGLAGLALTGIGVWKIVDLQQTVADMRAEMAAASKDDVFGIGESMAAAIHVSVGAGLWLLTVAGLGGAVAAVMMMLARRRATSMTTAQLGSTATPAAEPGREPPQQTA